MMPHNKGKMIGKMDRIAKNLSHLETELHHVQHESNVEVLEEIGVTLV
jgi:hypothetical protein